MTSVLAQVMGVAVSNNIPVRSDPNPRSEVLVTLARGKQVQVLLRQGVWYKIKISLQGGFDFAGWVPQNTIQVGGPTPFPQTAPTYVSPPPPPDPFLQSGPRLPKPSRSRTSRPVRRESSPISDRFVISAGPGVAVYQLTVSTAGTTPKTLFSYSVSGISLNAGVDYRFWQTHDGRLFSKAHLMYGRGFLQTTTNLRDSGTPPVTFATKKSNSSLDDLRLKISTAYRLKTGSTSPTIGGCLGYQYLSFQADDIKDISDTPINLFVSQKNQSMFLGVFGTFGLDAGNTLSSSVGIDLLILNSIKEEPAGATGTNPKAKIGFVPYIKLSYALAPRHQIGLAYDLRVQTTSFSGSASRVDTDNVTDGSSNLLLHQFIAKYELHF